MKKRFLRVFTAWLLMVLLMPTASYATQSYGGWKKVASISGLSYYGRTSIEQGSISMLARAYEEVGYYSGSTWVRYPLPPGYLLLYAGLKKNGVLIMYNGATNGSTAAIFEFLIGDDGVISSYYTAHGYAAGYNPSTGEYEGAYLIKSPVLYFYGSQGINSSSYESASLLSDINQRQVYEVTPGLETYGTLDIADVTGIMPDWILAQATNGETGYINSEEMRTTIPKNPAEALINFTTGSVNSIPVYAEPGGGETIGQFDIYFGE